MPPASEEDGSFVESGVGKAYDAWLGLSNDALELAAVIPFAFAYVVESTTNPDWKHINGLMGRFMACKTYDACKRSVDS
jgi:hypothetical protein